MKLDTEVQKNQYIPKIRILIEKYIENISNILSMEEKLFVLLLCKYSWIL